MMLPLVALIPILVGWVPPMWVYKTDSERIRDLEERIMELDQEIWDLSVCCSIVKDECPSIGRHE